MVCPYFELLIEQYCTHCTNTSFRIRQRWIGNPLGNSSSVCPGKSCVLATSCHGLDESWSGLFCFSAWLTGKRAFHNIFRHLTFDWAHYTRFKWEDSGWEWGPGLHFNWGNLFGPHFLSFSQPCCSSSSSAFVGHKIRLSWLMQRIWLAVAVASIWLRRLAQYFIVNLSQISKRRCFITWFPRAPAYFRVTRHV